MDKLTSEHYCRCLDGFKGDGYSCEVDILGCNIINNCGKYALCEFNPNEGGYRCTCDEARVSLFVFSIDIRTQIFIDEIRNEMRNFFFQLLLQGFKGDGFRCRPSVSCHQNTAVCDANAICVPNVSPGQGPDYVCECRKNFLGDGYMCERKTFLRPFFPQLSFVKGSRESLTF